MNAELNALHQRLVQAVYEDVGEAERLLAEAREVAGRIGTPAALGVLARCEGHVHFARARYEEAARHYRQARDLLHAAGEEAEEGRTLMAGLQALIYSGAYDEALAWSDRACAIFTRTGDTVRLARLAVNTGNIHYRQDRYQEAIECYRAAYPELLSAGLPRDAAGVLANLAVCHISRQEFSQALECYEQARLKAEEHGLAPLAAAADYNIAFLHYLRGEYVTAARKYEQARQRSRSGGDLYHEALCDLDEAEMYLELNLSSHASSLAAAAARQFAALGMRYELGKALLFEGIALGQAGDLEAAANRLRKARAAFAKECNPTWLAAIDLYLALLEFEAGSYAGAARRCRRARDLLAGLESPRKLALCLLLEGQLARRKGRLDEALQLAQEAIHRLQDSQASSLVSQCWRVVGEIQWERGRRAEALEAFLKSRASIESVREALAPETFRIAFLADKLAVYDGLLSICLAGGEPGQRRQAFQYVQEAKSRTLTEATALFRAPGFETGSLAELRQSLHAAYREMEEAERRTQDGAGGPRSRLAVLRARSHDLEQRFLRQLAAASGTAPGQARQTTFEDVGACLPEGTVLLEYFPVRGVMHVAELSRRGLEIRPLAPVAQVEQSARFFRFHLGRQRAGAGTAEHALRAHLNELGAMVLSPCSGALQAGRLVIASHGSLHGIPFHAMRTANGFLWQTHRICFVPSGAVYGECSRRRPVPRASSLVLGVPDPDLPALAGEARHAAECLPGATLLLGRQATIEQIRRLAPECRYIHIAAHGLFRASNPLFSGIRLGGDLLSLFDLYQIPMPAELITLSGCNTGRAVVSGADEVLGAMRGFLLAGARCLLLSLWEVRDPVAAAFMRRFYSAWKTSQDIEAAWKTAVEQAEAESPSLFDWATFSLVGDPARAEEPQP